MYTISPCATASGVYAVAALFAWAFSACASQPDRLPEPREPVDALLIRAVRENRATDIPALLKSGADVNIINRSDGETPLMIAAVQGQFEAAQALLSAGANPNLRQHGQWDTATPLVRAAGNGHANIVKLLLDHGASVDARIGGRGAGPHAILWATLEGHTHAVAVLLAGGASVDRQDLFEAISRGHVDIARLLLAAGGDPTWTFANGSTVLEEARRSPLPTRDKMIEIVRSNLGPSQKTPNRR